MRGLLRTMLLACVGCTGLLLLGAAEPAPVLPTKGFYVNDYANILFQSHQDAVLALSSQLYEETGAQVVVLTVDSLQEREIESYARAILRAWQIGGPDSQNGALVLVYKGPEGNLGLTAGGLASLDSGAASRAEAWLQPTSFAAGNLSKAVMDVYRPLVARVYAANGITPDETAAALLEPPAADSSPFGGGTVVFLAILVLILARTYRTSRRYRQKYLKGHVRRVKTYARTYNEEDEYKNEKIYKIDYDGMD